LPQAFERAEGQPSTISRRARTAKDRDSITSVQVCAKCEQCAWIELARSAAQSVEMPLPCPDEALMATRQDLDGFRQC
jgi:hypothetical protein